MPLRRQGDLSCISVGTGWTKTIKYAIAPSYLDDCKSFVHGPNRDLFQSYVKYVERLRQTQSGCRGSRSLHDTAMEIVMKHMSEFETLEIIPKHLTKRLFNGLKKRYLQESIHN